VIRKLFWVIVVIAGFAYIEAAVVIYLRHIYYPEGFHFPLKRHYDYILTIEVMREFSTLAILVGLSAVLAGSRNSPAVLERAVRGAKFWLGFGYFVFMFGLWDILFYLWLKAAINWPASISDWDVLFLIPMPWLGPVIAPVSLSAIMILIGVFIVRLFEKGYDLKPGLIHWGIVLLGCGFILYSFMNDWDAMFFEKYPKPYRYELLIVGELLLIIPFILLYRKSISGQKDYQPPKE